MSKTEEITDREAWIVADFAKWCQVGEMCNVCTNNHEDCHGDGGVCELLDGFAIEYVENFDVNAHDGIPPHDAERATLSSLFGIMGDQTEREREMVRLIRQARHTFSAMARNPMGEEKTRRAFEKAVEIMDGRMAELGITKWGNES